MKNLSGILLFSILFLGSCFESDDLKFKTEGKTLEVAVGFPIIKGQFKISSIIPDDIENVEQYGITGLYKVKIPDIETFSVNYDKPGVLFPSLSTINSPALISIGGFPSSPTPLPIDQIITVPNTGPINFWTGGSEYRVDSIKFSPDVSMSIIGVNISLPATKYEVKIYIENVQSEPMLIFTESTPDSEKKIRFAGKTLTLENLRFKTEVVFKAGATMDGSDLTIGFSIGAMDFQTIWGNFSKLEIKPEGISGKKIPVPLPNFDDFQEVFDKVSIEDVKLFMDYSSTLGLKTKMTISLEQRIKSSGKYVKFVDDYILIDRSSVAGTEIKGKSAIDFPPLKLNFDTLKFAGVSLAILQDDKNSSFITFPLKLSIKPSLIIPLKVKMEDIEYTIYSEPIAEDADLEGARMDFTYDNKLNLQVGLSVLIMKNGLVSDSLVVKNGADNSGLLIGSGKGKSSINMNKDFANKLTTADSIGFKMKMATRDPNGNFVSFAIDTIQSFDLSVFVAVKGVFELDKKEN